MQREESSIQGVNMQREESLASSNAWTRKTGLKAFTSTYGYIPFALVLEIVLLSILSKNFLTLDNLNNIAFQMSILIIMTLGQFYPKLVGGLDFSAQAVIGLVSVIAAKYMTVIGIVPACLLAIGASALVGLVNGVIVVKWTASAMLVTLGMQWVVSGITLLFSSEAIWGLPEEFKFLGSGRIAGLPVAIFVAALLFALSFVICNYTAFGKRLYAVGANMETARLSGISAKTVKAIAFILGPVYVAVGSLVLTSAVATGQPSLGGNLTIQSMMALFIAGMRMGGGNGNIVSITCGAIFITIMYNGMNLLNVPSDMQLVAGGLLLVLALCITSRK